MNPEKTIVFTGFQIPKEEKIIEKGLHSFQADDNELLNTEIPINEHFNYPMPLQTELSEINQNYLFDDDQILAKKNEEDHHNCRKLKNLRQDYLGKVIQEDKPHTLTAGDKIQLGSTYLIFHEIRNQNSLDSTLNTSKKVDYLNSNMGGVENSTCRVCLGGVQDSDDVLVSPCDCSGSTKYIHINCLKTWIQYQLQNVNKNPNAKFYCLTSKSVTCELCKQIYPYKINFGDQEVDLINFPRPENDPYFIAEKVDPSGIRTVALIKNFPIVTIGRDLSSNIILHDSTGSRKHAVIRYEDGQFRMHDNKSKFGTIAEIKKPILHRDLKLKYKHCIFSVKKVVKIPDTDSEGESESTDDSQNERKVTRIHKKKIHKYDL